VLGTREARLFGTHAEAEAWLFGADQAAAA
jgi:hypothetical protein